MPEIRHYTDTDLESLRRLMIQLQAHERQLIATHVEPTPQFAEWYISRLLKELAVEHGVVLVALEDNFVCGFTAGYGKEEWESQSSYFYIAELVVSQEYRGQGIGSALIQAMETLARERGFTRLMIGVLVGNDGAHKLYKRLGFHEYAIELIKPL